MKMFPDVFGPIPEELPPLREINHEIPLIDKDKTYNYRLPKCPEAIKPALFDKIAKYTRAGWWRAKAASQAAPMPCLVKKNGDIRTVFDLRPRNDNTVKDVTPFPDQDTIRNDIARAKFKSKGDLSNAYEQVRTEPDHVDRTSFATINGTYVSEVMQQGDCNAPSTFQRLMTHIFRDYIGRFVHVYLDDIYIYSDTKEDHMEHIRLVLEKLREQKFYLSPEKTS